MRNEDLFIHCACFDPGHGIVLSSDIDTHEDYSYADFYASMQVAPCTSLFGRICMAFKYILFNNTNRSRWNTTILSDEDLERIALFISKHREEASKLESGAV